MAEIAQMTRKAVKQVAKNKVGKDGSMLKDPKGMAAAGVGIAVLPFAVEQIAKRVAPKVSEVASDLGEQAKQTAKDATKDAAKEKLSPGNLVQSLIGGGGDGDEGKAGKEGGLLSSLKPGSSGGGEGDEGKAGKEGGLLSSLKPGSSDDGDGDEEHGRAAPGYGSGRRMPVQQGVSVAAPLKTVYNGWTQFEDWPDFMHRLESAEQVDDATVAFTTKVWGITRRFEAKIMEQRPEERIEWNVEQGLSHTGVVTFHQLSDRLTRIEVTVDIEPHGLIEKAGRGMRFAKRAIRGDLHRFKAFVELADEEPSGWRGTIEDGEVKRKTDRPSRRRSRSRSNARGSGTRSSRSQSSSSSGSRSSSSSRSRSSNSNRSRSSTSSRSRNGSSGGSKRRSSSSSRSGSRS